MVTERCENTRHLNVFAFFSAEFKPKKMKTEESEKKAKKRKQGEEVSG